MTKEFDLVVIGAGSGAAAVASRFHPARKVVEQIAELTARRIAEANA